MLSDEFILAVTTIIQEFKGSMRDTSKYSHNK